MAWKDVYNYTLSWWHEGSRGEIVLSFRDREPISCKSLRYDNYAPMVDIFRHEKPVWFEDAHNILMASHEQPREMPK